MVFRISWIRAAFSPMFFQPYRSGGSICLWYQHYWTPPSLTDPHLASISNIKWSNTLCILLSISLLLFMFDQFGLIMSYCFNTDITYFVKFIQKQRKGTAFHLIKLLDSCPGFTRKTGECCVFPIITMAVIYNFLISYERERELLCQCCLLKGSRV